MLLDHQQIFIAHHIYKYIYKMYIVGKYIKIVEAWVQDCMLSAQGFTANSSHFKMIIHKTGKRSTSANRLL